MSHTRRNKYLCPLSGKKFRSSFDRDLNTELTAKELSKPKLKLIKKEKK